MGAVAAAYQRKQCVQEAINEWWPGETAIGGRDFMPSMRALQIELIHCHFEHLSDEDRERAVQTLYWLEDQ